MMSRKLSVIILCSQTINKDVITNARTLNPYEIIVVMPDTKNKGLITFAEENECKVIIKEDTGRNEGYVTAVKIAGGDVLLFLKTDIALNPSLLSAFLKPIMDGHVQVVLNNLTSKFLQKRVKQWPDTFTLWRQVFNDAIGFSQLFIDSLISMPHAYTKEVIKSIGFESFENPVVAHMRILEQGLSISRHISIQDTLSGDEINPEQSYFKVPLTDAEKVCTKYFLEALAEWHRVHGVRGSYHDGGRRRNIIKDIKENNNLSAYAKIYKGKGMISSKYNNKQVSVIIPAQNEEKTIEAVIQQARIIEPKEIIVIINGSSDKTEEIVKKMDATVIVFEEPLGHDVGRSIGALEATGDILLFIDADFPISADYLFQFCKAVENGVDVALNDLNINHFPLYIVNLYKYMLNIACDRKELGVGSILAVPHALSKACVDGVGWDSLLNPNEAHVKAILQGYHVANVQFVDVMSPNRIRPDQHFSNTGHPKAVLRINGDHLESLAYLLERSQLRGAKDGE